MILPMFGRLSLGVVRSFQTSAYHCKKLSSDFLSKILSRETNGNYWNLKRLETLGDSFLKLSITNYAFEASSSQDEGRLSNFRFKEIKKLSSIDKALIGGCLVSLGPAKALELTKWLDIKVLTEKSKPRSPVEAFTETKNLENRQRIVLQLYEDYRFCRLEEKIGYDFRDKAFLIQAFTHTSFNINRATGSYERLEFLGDAVLEYLITRYLYEHKKHYSPGVLTDLRSALVNNDILASLTVKYDLQRFFLHTSLQLNSRIEKFVKLNKQKGQVNFNDDMSLTNEDEIIDGMDNHQEAVKAPKILADIFESLVGAIYLDCGSDLGQVWEIFYAIMKETIITCCLNPPQSPIKELLEMKNIKTQFSKLENYVEKEGVIVTVDTDNGRLSFTGKGRHHANANKTEESET